MPQLEKEQCELSDLAAKLDARIEFFSDHRDQFQAILEHLENQIDRKQIEVRDFKIEEKPGGKLLEARFQFSQLPDFIWSLMLDESDAVRIFALNVAGRNRFEHFWIGNGGSNGKWVIIKHVEKKTPTKDSLKLAECLCRLSRFTDLKTITR